jgi:hypothetical protein
VQLAHTRFEPGGDRRHQRLLERAGRDDDLASQVRPAGRDDLVPAVDLGERLYSAVELDRQLEPAGVVGQIADDLVAGRIVIRIAREGLSGQAAVAGRGEQLQRVPPPMMMTP